jgi:RimJ/RimL family protein N-acetyltransferase
VTPSELSGASVTPPSAGDAGTGRLEIRPIEPGDRAAFVEAYARLGERSRYRRFLTPHGPLSDAELRYFTEVDHHDHEALVAIDPATGAGVGVARYVRSRTDPTTAEVAVAVVDDWQGRGVGTRLATALTARGRHEGIRSFTALMLAENAVMLNLIKELGEVRERHVESGTVQVTIDLPDRGIRRWVSRLLRAVAKDELRFHLHGGKPADPAPPA